MASSWHAEPRRLNDEEEVDRIAEAVLVLRRSGLFKVEPVETQPERSRTVNEVEEIPTQGLQDEEENLFSLRGGLEYPHVTDRRGRPTHKKNPIGAVFSSPQISPALPRLAPPASFARYKSSTPLPFRTSMGPFANTSDHTHHSPHRETSTLPKTELNFRTVPSRNIPRAEIPVNSDTNALSFIGHPPRISTFSGSNTKIDVSFEAWKFEVKCLMNDNTINQDLLLHGVRKSLRGEPSKLCMHLGETASVETILRKLESVYGIVESGTTLLQQFYNAKQENDESVALFGCRLEEIVNKATNRGAVAQDQANEMLKSKLWTGLKDERVKNAARYKYERISDFDTLRAELRAIEQEIKESDGLRARTYKTPRAFSMPQGEVQSDSTLKELTKRVQNIEEKISKQQDTSKLLNRILEKIDRLEELNRKEDAGQTTRTENKPSNYRGPLRRDNQRANYPKQ